MQAIGVAGRQNDGARDDDDVFAGDELRQNTPPTEPSGLRSSAVATVSSSRGMPALMTCLRRRSMNGTPELP